MFFSKIINALKAFCQCGTGRHGVAKTFLNASKQAAIIGNMAIIRSQLENTKNETEKKQLEKELREAQASYSYYTSLVNEDREANAQSRDRLSRILGTDAERAKHLFREKRETGCPLKQKGDRFEIQVGRSFEKEGCFVLYNGMLRSEADQGVDLVAYNAHTKEAHYIQCKNWEKMKLDFDDIMRILKKMSSQHIFPTSVEIKHQQQAGWANGSHFDDRVYYKVKYCLVVANRESITPEAAEKIVLGFVSTPQGSGNASCMKLFCFNNNKLEPWFYL